jgi:hypothetical protein
VFSSNVSNVAMSDVVVEHTAADLTTCLAGACDDQSVNYLSTASLHWQYSNNIVLTNVNVTHTGGYAVWFDKGVTNAKHSRSFLTDLGETVGVSYSL